MQIFVLDKDPTQAARWHSDVHVNKMLLESCQLLSGAHWMTGRAAPYKLTHKHHPCAKWVRTSTANYKWLHTLACTLEDEYHVRRKLLGKPFKQHACHEVLAAVTSPPPLPLAHLTDFVVAMSDEQKKVCVVKNDVVATYRNFYNYYKRGGRHATWVRNKPPWWLDSL